MDGYGYLRCAAWCGDRVYKRKLKKEVGVRTLMVKGGGGGVKGGGRLAGFSSVRGWQRYRQVDGLVGRRYETCQKKITRVIE